MKTIRIGDNEFLYSLIPTREDDFRTLLINRKEAIRKFIFTDETSHQDTWNTSKFGKDTNLKSSISTAVSRVQN